MKRGWQKLVNELKAVDLILEVLDARAPETTRNLKLRHYLAQKPLLVILNKSDLARPEATAQWLKFFNARESAALAIDAHKGTGIENIFKYLEEGSVRRTRFTRAARFMIIGIPNVGKSTLVNRLAGKRAARTGDQPGTTRGRQWIRLRDGLELLDTPGLIHPEIRDEEAAFRLAALGTVKEKTVDREELAIWLISFLQENYPGIIECCYEIEESLRPLQLMELIGRRRGCLRSGGVIDYLQVSTMVIKDFRSGKLGRITLELPGGGEEVETKGIK
ncbi:MAG: ribosome biogenesis GTPase YlqF [Dethiobacteria bacterium]